jgi:hypothetical protein
MNGRTSSTKRDCKARCEQCHGSKWQWFGGQAQGTAAQHTDQTGHTTICAVEMTVTYSRRPFNPPTVRPKVSPAAAAAFVGLAPKAVK